MNRSHRAFLLGVGLIFLIAASARAEENKPAVTEWKSLGLKLAGLETWGTRHYAYSAREPGGKAVGITGTMTVATEVTPDAVILRDQFEITYRGEKLTLEMVHTCRRDNFLSPLRIESKGEGSDEFRTYVATVADGKATVRSKESKVTVSDVPAGTITTAALMRLVTLVPRTPGAIFAFGYSLESEELHLKQNYQLRVMPPETLACGSGQVKCAKFELTGGGIQPAYYWVTEDGVLQRMMMDGRKVMELVPVR